MTDLQENAPTYHKAVSGEWDSENGNDILLYDDDGTLIDIYREFDLIDVVILHHNTTIARDVKP